MSHQLTLATRSEVVPGSQPAFETVVNFTLGTVSQSSQRVYAQTYQKWAAWCEDDGMDALDLTPAHVLDFLRSQPVTKRTRQRQLSALRKLARVLALDYTNPQYRAIHEALLLVKTPTENIGGNEREGRALNAQEVWRVLDYWGEDAPIHKRNKAILAVMFYTGMRRAEIADLRWTDIDLQAGVIRVRHGKGDKQREVAIVEGTEDIAVNALQVWCDVLDGTREFVFCPIAKGGKIGADKPMNVRVFNQIVEYTSQALGIPFTPHDARRTLGTDLLAQGKSSVADVQGQLGHAHASTTLQGYALPADARKRRVRFKTSY